MKRRRVVDPKAFKLFFRRERVRRDGEGLIQQKQNKNHRSVWTFLINYNQFCMFPFYANMTDSCLFSSSLLRVFELTKWHGFKKDAKYGDTI